MYVEFDLNTTLVAVRNEDEITENMPKFSGSSLSDHDVMLVLQRIEEHDAMIQTLSQRQDRDQYLSAITTMLGLRGHMYGELIRIQMMLAKDDPQMKVMHLTVDVFPSLDFFLSPQSHNLIC